MATSSSLKTVADPVCGAAVGADSVHRVMNGSLLYCFCSAACREIFLADPMRYAIAAVLRADGSAPARTGVPHAAPAAAPRDLDTDPQNAFASEETDWGGQPPGARPGHGAVPPARQASQSVAATPAGAHRSGMLDRLLPGREKRFARRVCEEMLALHKVVVRQHPDLRGRALYQRIAMVRLHTDAAAADRLLLQADESFASWPTPRDINYGDVVHMVAIREFHAQYGKAHWIIADMGRIVADIVDHRL